MPNKVVYKISYFYKMTSISFIYREDWGTLGNIRGITTPLESYYSSLHILLFKLLAARGRTCHGTKLHVHALNGEKEQLESLLDQGGGD